MGMRSFRSSATAKAAAPDAEACLAGAIERVRASGLLGDGDGDGEPDGVDAAVDAAVVSAGDVVLSSWAADWSAVVDRLCARGADAFATMLRSENIVYRLQLSINSLGRLDRGIQGIKQTVF